MALNTPFNSSMNVSEAMGNISLLDPNYTGINWVRDNAMSTTGGDAAITILLGLLVALFFVFIAIPNNNNNRYAAACVSTLGTFFIGILFWFWEFLPNDQVFILFIIFVLFVLSAVGLYNHMKDKKESLQL